jgi:hypothetical protein
MPQVTPKVGFFETTVGKTTRAAAYVAISAVIAYLISATTNTPTLFGPYTVIANAALVAIKGLLSDQQNLPS